jgi:hypothetical protein
MNPEKLATQIDWIHRKLDAIEEAHVLLNDPVMHGWLQRQMAEAEQTAIHAIEKPTTHFAKAQASGILRSWRRKLGELQDLTAPGLKDKLLARLEKLTKQQEALYAESGTDDGRSTRDSEPIPFGEF